jgi:hypothetical protein
MLPPANGSNAWKVRSWYFRVPLFYPPQKKGCGQSCRLPHPNDSKNIAMPAMS